MIYYGDEGALNAPSLANGPNGPEDDPYNRAPYPWADESGNPNVYGPADGSVIGYYTALAHLRKQHPSLRTGSFETLLTGDTTPSGTDNMTYAFARVGGGEKAVVALNNGGSNNTASIPVAAYFADGTQLQDALSGTTYTTSGGNVNITLAARSAVVLFPFPAVVDTTPPVASINVDPPANGNGWNNSAVIVTLSATDSSSGVKELRYWLDNGSVTVVPGSSTGITFSTECTPTTISLRAIDNAGNISTLASQVVRVDTIKPTIAGVSATPSVLKPPNHRLVNVAVNYNVTDSCDPSPNCELSVTSNEPVNTADDGNTSPDWEIVDPHHVLLRAERSGTGTGRVYAITITCTDRAGNSLSKTLTVKVPLK
jgi:hypothetical protein